MVRSGPAPLASTAATAVEPASGRGGGRQAGGLPDDHEPGVLGDQLGERADLEGRHRRDEAEHFVADGDIGPVRPDLVHGPREVPADDRRQVVRHHRQQVAVGLEHVEAVDARGVDADPDAIRAGRRIGQVHDAGGLVGAGQGERLQRVPLRVVAWRAAFGVRGAAGGPARVAGIKLRLQR